MAYDDIQRERAVADLHAAYRAAYEALADRDEVEAPVLDLLLAAGDVGRLLAPEESWPHLSPEG